MPTITMGYSLQDRQGNGPNLGWVHTIYWPSILSMIPFTSAILLYR